MRSKVVLSKAEWLKQEKAKAKARKQRGEQVDGYLKLARVLIHGPRRRPKKATDCRRQQEMEASGETLHQENLRALLEMQGTEGLKKLVKDLVVKHGRKRKPKESKKLRVRPVNPKLYKISDGVTQSLMHGFLACRKMLQYTLRGWRSVKTKAAMTYGSIFHDLLEYYYIGIMAGKVDENTPFRRFARKHTKLWIKKNSHRLRHGGDLKMALHEAAKVCAVFPAYCHFHEEDFKELDWQALEGVFDIMWNGFRLKGRWDGLYKLDKKLWLFETKTKSRFTKDDIREMLAFDFQSLFYITALSERRREPIEGVRYNVVRNPGLKQGKTESTKALMRRIAEDAEKRQAFYFVRFESPYDKEQRAEFEKELVMKLQEMKDWLDGKLATYKNEGSCIRRFKCDFMSACASGTMAGYLGKGKLFTELA